MARRIVVIVLVLVLAVVVYLGYTTYDAKRAGASGDVYSTDSGSSKTKTPVSDTTDAPDAKPADDKAVVYPPAGEQTSRTADAAALPASAATGAAAPTGGDTIAPNPPNGEVFAGKGKYQLYRQGNITWRLDTDTGKTCIIFATDEEWKKPKVLRAGCGR